MSVCRPRDLDACCPPGHIHSKSGKTHIFFFLVTNLSNGYCFPTEVGHSETDLTCRAGARARWSSHFVSVLPQNKGSSLTPRRRHPLGCARPIIHPAGLRSWLTHSSSTFQRSIITVSSPRLSEILCCLEPLTLS